MKSLEVENVNSFNINHTFFFTTEKNNMRIDYTSLTNFINAYNGDITICPTYSLNGEDVRMDGIKGNSPALYVAIIDSVKDYFRRIEEEGISLTITEKEVVNILCGILHLSNDREEAICDVSEATDVFDFDDDTDGKLENIQALLMEYLPVFYDTTDSAYEYYCELMRLTPDAELADIQDAFHRLKAAMSFPRTMTEVMKKSGDTDNTERKELISFDEWTDGYMDTYACVDIITRAARQYFKNAVQVDGVVQVEGKEMANIYISSCSDDSDIVSKNVTAHSIKGFIDDALDDLEEDLVSRLFSSASIIMFFGEHYNTEKRYEFDVSHVLRVIYEDEFKASGYSKEEIEEANEVDF